MTIKIEKSVNQTVLQLTGRLDTLSAPALDKTIEENLHEIKSLVLDFKCLEYISSAGLRVLLSAQKKLQKIATMKLINVCEEILNVFEMTGFADILTIE